MMDIVSISTDLVMADAQNPKAANVLSVQLGDLEYAPTFGIDIEFFIDPEFQFQNESFKSYLIQRLSEHHVNVNEVLETVEKFSMTYHFFVGEPESITEGFIR
jgi:hypothetical protein